VHPSAHVDSKGEDVVRIQVGALDSSEVNALECLLKFFLLPVKVISFVGEVPESER
jgi:hypothetical protein